MTHLNQHALARYLSSEGLAGSLGIETIQIAGGQSNPTYLIKSDRGQFVLRKKPGGKLLPSAHAIDREFRVMHALRESKIPVPRVLTYCADAKVLGTEFFIMEFVEGRVLVDQSLPGMSPGERTAIYQSLNKVLADLHSVDVTAIGLSDFGKTGDYVGRQLARWTRQCLESSVDLPPAMHHLMQWLPRNAPRTDSIALVHGDYRLDNVILHPHEPRIVGVLDWELSTLGDPIADFAYHCMSWRIPPSLWRGIAGLDLNTLGIPSEAQHMEQYCANSGRDVTKHWRFYIVYNLFRMAAILHGIAERVAHGNAASADAAEVGRKSAPLAELAWQLANEPS